MRIGAVNFRVLRLLVLGALIVSLCACVGRPPPDGHALEARFASVERDLDQLRLDGKEMQSTLRSAIEQIRHIDADAADRMRSVESRFTEILNAMRTEAASSHAHLREISRDFMKHLEASAQSGAWSRAMIEAQETTIMRLEQSVRELEKSVLECSKKTCDANCPSGNKGDLESKFNETAFIALGALEAICFGVLSLLFSVYVQFMQSLDTSKNRLPPLATREIVIGSRVLTGIIVVSGLAGLPPLFYMDAPDTLYAVSIKLVIAAVIVALGVAAFRLVWRMRVPDGV
jgi:hypothetical protein